MAVAQAELDRLCQELGPTLYRYALARTRKTADAEDLAQEALYRLLRALGRGELIGDPLRWALVVVSNALRRRGRHGWRWMPLDASALEVRDGSPDAAEIVQSDLSNARIALGSLSDQDHDNVVLAEIRDLTDSQLSAVFGVTRGGARMRLMRSVHQLRLAYMHTAVGYEPKTPDCQRLAALIPSFCVGTLVERRANEVEAHAAQCDNCRQAEERMRQLVKDALTALFPIPADLHPRLKERVTAALLADQQRRRPGLAMVLWFMPDRNRAGRRRPGRALPLLLLLLLLALFGITPHALATPPIQLDVKGAHFAVSPSPPMPWLPTPSSAAVTSSPSGSPTPNGVPVAVDPCPAGPTGAYADLDRGEVNLRSAIGAPLQRLTNTGGLVDYYWWSPNGALIAYKTSSSGTSLGSISIMRVATRQVVASLSAPAIFFSFSPDSSSWVSVAPIVQSTAYQGRPGFTDFRAMVGSVTSGSSQRTFTVAGIPGNVQPWPGNYSELHWVPQTVGNEPWGVYWLPDAIYFDQGTGDQMTHTFTSAGDSPDPWTSQSGGQSFQDRLLGVGANSAFLFKPWTGVGTVQVDCAGRISTVDSPRIVGPAETLSVSPDGRSALITDVMLYPCRLDNYLLKADGVVLQLDNDCYSSLAHWQP